MSSRASEKADIDALINQVKHYPARVHEDDPKTLIEDIATEMKELRDQEATQAQKDAETEHEKKFGEDEEYKKEL